MTILHHWKTVMGPYCEGGRAVKTEKARYARTPEEITCPKCRKGYAIFSRKPETKEAV